MIMGLDTTYKTSSALTTLYKKFEVTVRIRLILKNTASSSTGVTLIFHKLLLRTIHFESEKIQLIKRNQNILLRNILNNYLLLLLFIRAFHNFFTFLFMCYKKLLLFCDISV
jgi:hypothetical protein